MNFSQRFKKGSLIVGDVLFFYLSLWLALEWRFVNPIDTNILENNFFPFSIVYLFWLAIFYTVGLYDLNLARNNLAFYSISFKSLLACGLFGLAFFYLFPDFGIEPKAVLLLNLGIFSVLFFLWRQFFNIFIKLPALYGNIVILGKNPQSLELAKKIESSPQLGYKIIKIIDPETENLIESIEKHRNSTIISAIDLRKYPEFVKKIYKKLLSSNIENFSSFYEKMTGKIPASQINEIWFLENIKLQEKESYEKIKRFTDILIGITLTLFLLILIIPISIAIRINSPGSTFYKQIRVGKNGKIFELIKFRSMVKNAEKGEAIWAQKDDPRITNVGKILRKTLIDELPQAINILKGDISFLGPRPERPEFFEELEEKIPFYQIRHLIKPGLTGWAQVNYRYGNTIEDALEKLQYDLFYLKNRSFILDLKIFLKTISVFLRGGTL